MAATEASESTGRLTICLSPVRPSWRSFAIILSPEFDLATPRCFVICFQYYEWALLQIN